MNTTVHSTSAYYSYIVCLVIKLCDTWQNQGGILGNEENIEVGEE